MSIKVYLSGGMLQHYAKRDAQMISNLRKYMVDYYEKRCSRCGVGRFEHAGNHPYFENNLEMLEWYAHKKEFVA